MAPGVVGGNQEVLGVAGMVCEVASLRMEVSVSLRAGSMFVGMGSGSGWLNVLASIEFADLPVLELMSAALCSRNRRVVTSKGASD